MTNDGNSNLFLLTKIIPNIRPTIKISTIINTNSTSPSPINWNACSCNNIIVKSQFFLNQNNYFLLFNNLFYIYKIFYKNNKNIVDENKKDKKYLKIILKRVQFCNS